ncbi:MAG: type II toxin-antitoxin system PemK/MazF family toxin [Candidatus Gracilibacteria bacterium]|nr:type II toxin-antitoxin system PemK/MazF family toxin [Candidatus Gracilibacteria bacterium]
MIENKIEFLKEYLNKIKTDVNLKNISDFLDWFYEKANLHFNEKKIDLKLNKGEIYLMNLGRNIGSELNKNRPCIIYSNYYFNNGNNVTIVPLKTYKGKINRNLNIFIEKNNTNKLESNSIVDISGIKQISKKRIGFKIGFMEEKSIEKIDKKIIKFLGIKKQTVTK